MVVKWNLESTRQRVESSQPKNHEDHILKAKDLLQWHITVFVHKFVPMLQAMKSPDAKAKESKRKSTLQH